MKCNCLCEVDFEAAELQRVEIVTAKKHHFCGECEEAILPGERYECVTSLYDGRWNTDKTCLSCMRVRDSLLCSWIFGEVWECLEDCLGLSIEDLPQTFKTEEIICKKLSDKAIEISKLQREGKISKEERDSLIQEWRTAAQ